MIPTRHFIPRAFDIKIQDENHRLDAIRYLIQNSDLFKRRVMKFEVGKKVFDTLYGYGEVISTTPECDEDTYPVAVVFKKDQEGERVEFYDHDGKSIEHDHQSLFNNKYDAITYIQKVKKDVRYSRVFNFYDDGFCSEHIDDVSSIAGQTYQETQTSRTLVKRHKVQWSN